MVCLSSAPSIIAARRPLITALKSSKDFANDSTPSFCNSSPTSLRSIPIDARRFTTSRAASRFSSSDAQGFKAIAFEDLLVALIDELGVGDRGLADQRRNRLIRCGLQLVLELAIDQRLDPAHEH